MTSPKYRDIELGDVPFITPDMDREERKIVQDEVVAKIEAKERDETEDLPKIDETDRFVADEDIEIVDEDTETE